MSANCCYLLAEVKTCVPVNYNAATQHWQCVTYEDAVAPLS